MSRAFWPAALLALLSACNAADDPDGGRQLGQLSAGEVQDLCDSISTELGKTVTLEARCRFDAATSTDSAADCALALDACMEAGGPDLVPECRLPSRQHDGKCAELPVDEVLPCVDELVEERLAVTCDDAPHTEITPECITRLTADCPFSS